MTLLLSDNELISSPGAEQACTRYFKQRTRAAHFATTPREPYAAQFVGSNSRFENYYCRFPQIMAVVPNIMAVEPHIVAAAY